MRKSKSKPRTNWKQRALHCEEVIKIQNVLAESREAKVRNLDVTIAMQNYELDYKGRDLVGLQDDIEKLTARAESAEKHNALLLEERQRHENVLVNQSLDNFTVASNSAHATVTIYDKYIPQNPPTRWQRFKSYFMAGLRGE